MRQYNLRSSFRYPSDAANSLSQSLAAKLVGQPIAIQTIVPYVQIHQASLAPDGGNFKSKTRASGPILTFASEFGRLSCKCQNQRTTRK